MSSSLTSQIISGLKRKSDCAEPGIRPVTKTCSAQSKCHFCEFIETSHWDPRPASPSCPESTSACPLCLTEPSTFPPYQPATDDCKTPEFPVCVDPECPENVCDDCPLSPCDDCSDDGEDCEACLEDPICGLECPVTASADRPDGGACGGVALADSLAVLFSDQSVQMLDVYGCTSQPPLASMPVSELGPWDAKLSISPGSGLASQPWKEQNEFELPLLLAEFSEYCKPLEAAGAAPAQVKASHNPLPVFNCGWLASSVPKVEGFREDKTRVDTCSSSSAFVKRDVDTSIARFAPQVPSPDFTSQPAQENNAVTVFSKDTRLSARSGRHKPKPPPLIRCLWIPPDSSNPCNELHPPGLEMHTHLKAAHASNSTNYCHWLGCRVGIHPGTTTSKPQAHRFAHSATRHTWTHSQYRPYLCPHPTCSEGFAAAALRDEHYANLHLGQKSFQCDRCSHQCSSARNLKRHVDEKHGGFDKEATTCIAVTAATADAATAMGGGGAGSTTVSRGFQCEFCAAVHTMSTSTAEVGQGNQAVGGGTREGKGTRKMKIYPRASNLARHFRKCREVLRWFPDAPGATSGKIDDSWFPPGYRSGQGGMERARARCWDQG